MAQQNQEMTPVDSANLPLKRKRGRPRKYDYDNLGYEQHRRYLQHKAFLSEANSAVGSSLGPQAFASQVNPTAISSIGLQAISSQAFPTTSSGLGIQAIPTQANLGACSSLRLQSVPIQTNPTSCPIVGAQSFGTEADSTANSSYGARATPGVNPSASIGCRPEAVPAQAQSAATSIHHSQVIPTLANSAVTASHVPNDLLGQAVCGTLDGTFDAGYLLTVQVANTGHVLKGLVFDPRLCVPISAETDIAPLLRPVTTPNGTPSSIVEAHSQTVVSIPIHPIPMPFAAPSQTVNHLLATSRLPHTASQLDTNKVAPDADPQLSTNKVVTNDTDSGLNAPHSLQAEVQAKIPDILAKSSINDAKQESSPAAPQQVLVDNLKAEDLFGLSAVNKETSQITLDVPSKDESTNIVDSLGVEQSMHRVKDSSTNMVESSLANEEMHQTEESSGIMIEVAGGGQGQHCLEETLQGMQHFNDPTSDKQEQPYGEPRSQAGGQNLLASAIPQESTS